MFKKFLALASLMVVSGCVTTSSNLPPLVEGDVTAIATTQRPAAISTGSLMPVSAGVALDQRGLFGERRASKIGDTLVVVLNEITSARQSGSSNFNKRSDNSFGTNLRADISRTLGYGTTGPTSPTQNAALASNGGLRGATVFEGNGGSSAANQFNGVITVTVVEVLPNGNLRVAGDKRIAVGAEEELIRFGGVVSPLDMEGNSVLSSYVADARIEYRGSGIGDSVKSPGALTRFFLRR